MRFAIFPLASESSSSFLKPEDDTSIADFILAVVSAKMAMATLVSNCAMG
jgi:hypothetical protein